MPKNSVYYLRGNVARSPRKTIDSKWFPIERLDVPLMSISGRGNGVSVIIANSIADKLKLLEGYGSGDLLLAAWPGKTRQDVFVVDKEDIGRTRARLNAKQAGK